MKDMVRVFLVIAFLIGSAAISHAGPIVNGGFEDPFCDGTSTSVCQPGDSWGLFSSIPGWVAVVGDIEIGDGDLYGVTGFEGNQVLELDANSNSVVGQLIAGPGTFVLSFLYADRDIPGTNIETFDVYWNSVLVASVVPLANPPNGAMQLFTAIVTANAGVNSIGFVGTGTSDSLGALIDDVQLNSVPDGGLTALLLGVGVFGLRLMRRMVP